MKVKRHTPSKWSDYNFNKPSGKVRHDTAHVDPWSYAGKVMRCRITTSGALTGRNVNVRVEKVGTKGTQAWVVELDGRLAGKRTRVQIEALFPGEVTE